MCDHCLVVNTPKYLKQDSDLQGRQTSNVLFQVWGLKPTWSLFSVAETRRQDAAGVCTCRGGVGHLWQPWPWQAEESLSLWQESVMKKHFWTHSARLVYLLCLWVALSSVFLPNWILCTHSHRRIGVSSYARRIYLLARGAFAFMCLRLLCVMTATALPLTSICISSQPTRCLRPPLWYQKQQHSEQKRCSSDRMNMKPQKWN